MNLHYEDNREEIKQLISIMPSRVEQQLLKHENLSSLIEVVLDLGAKPEVRFLWSDRQIIDQQDVTMDDLNAVVSKVGKFNHDNRAGIERTLHRISCIRNREGKIIGLTCRVGRMITGTIEIIQDLVESGKSILLLGPPGSGKTTKLREIARVLSDDFRKRVIVVDTSNEIAGDGDIPHPGIGSSRRMQVPSPDLQHAVMIEAVENHNPETIIVDEIGTEAEAIAAGTIAERGVQLVATAHGYTLENLIRNTTLSNLVGGIQSVILGDEEAKFRGTQKTVLERKGESTFHCLVEVRERDVFAIYKNLEEAVDAYLRHEPLIPEIRHRNQGTALPLIQGSPGTTAKKVKFTGEPCHIFPYGINQQFLTQAAHVLEVPVEIVSLGDADFVLTLRAHMGAKSKLTTMLNSRNIPVHVIKQNTYASVAAFMRYYFKLTESQDDIEREAQREIQQICNLVNDEGRAIDTSPHPENILMIQLAAASEKAVRAEIVGEAPNRRIRVFPV